MFIRVLDAQKGFTAPISQSCSCPRLGETLVTLTALKQDFCPSDKPATTVFLSEV